MKRKVLVVIVLLAVAVFFNACGGSSNSSNNNNGGGSGNPPPTPGQAQGIYEGTTSLGSTFNAIDLPNDMMYAVYGNQVGNVLYICGLVTGQGKSNNGTYTVATVTDYDYCGTNTQVVNTGSLSGTYVTGASMNGTLTEPANTSNFTATMPPSSQFNFSTAASVGAVSGPWSGQLTDGESANVTIDSTGSIVGSSSNGCTFTATMTPDSSGKNFFNVSLSFGGSPCQFANQNATGIAVNYLLSDGVTTQFIAGVTDGSQLGIVFTAQR